jgi:hypothetical protein
MLHLVFSLPSLNQKQKARKKRGSILKLHSTFHEQDIVNVIIINQITERFIP